MEAFSVLQSRVADMFMGRRQEEFSGTPLSPST